VLRREVIGASVTRGVVAVIAAIAAGACVEGRGPAASGATGACAMLGLDGDPAGDPGADACAAVMALRLPATLPTSPGNAHADDERAAALGQALFFGAGLARGADVRCATCHLPELAFRDQGPVSTGLARGVRNAPTTLDAARLTVWFWDGRADSLWSQPLFALENPREMDFTRLELAHRIADDDALRGPYEAVFGALPDVAALPARGKPGDPAWDQLDLDAQRDVDRIAAGAGKAIEAYLRRATSGAAPLDAFLDGDAAAMAPIAQRGLAVMATAGCLGCHAGPMLSDGAFHDVGLPSLPGAAPDRGRADGARIAAASVFNAAGPFADLPGPAPALDEAAVGAFRTPSLRDVVSTPPYGHDGALATLDDVLAVHAAALGPDDRAAVLAFLLALDGARPPRPWGDWPHPQ
jgi:cytochrome c peroxidase